MASRLNVTHSVIWHKSFGALLGLVGISMYVFVTHCSQSIMPKDNWTMFFVLSTSWRTRIFKSFEHRYFQIE